MLWKRLKANQMGVAHLKLKVRIVYPLLRFRIISPQAGLFPYMSR